MYVCVCVYVCRRWWQRLVRWHRQSDTNEGAGTKEVELEQYASSPRFPRKSSSTVPSDANEDVVDGEGVVPVIVEGRSQVGNGTVGYYNDEVKLEDEESTVSGKVSSEDLPVRQWPTSWWWQLSVLTVRTFRQSRHVILSRLNCIQTLLMSILVSLVWFQLPTDERSIRDREGFVSGGCGLGCGLKYYVKVVYYDVYVNSFYRC